MLAARPEGRALHTIRLGTGESLNRRNVSATRTAAKGGWIEPLEGTVWIVADPEGTLVEIGQQPRKHERRLLIGGLTPFGPSHEDLPAITGVAGRIDRSDVTDDDI